MSLYEQRLTRGFQSTLKTLQQMQAPRLEKRSASLNTAVELRTYFLDIDKPWNPADDGFVFSTEYLDRTIALRSNLELAQKHSQPAPFYSGLGSYALMSKAEMRRRDAKRAKKAASTMSKAA